MFLPTDSVHWLTSSQRGQWWDGCILLFVNIWNDECTTVTWKWVTNCMVLWSDLFILMIAVKLWNYIIDHSISCRDGKGMETMVCKGNKIVSQKLEAESLKLNHPPDRISTECKPTRKGILSCCNIQEQGMCNLVTNKEEVFHRTA